MSKFTELGFTSMDGFILISCISAAVIGALVDYTFKRESYVVIREEAEVKLPFSRYFPLIIARSLIGAVAGVLVYLLLLGSLSVDKSSYARLLILAAFSGYAAPAYVKKYESRITDLASKIVTDVPNHVKKPSASDG